MVPPTPLVVKPPAAVMVVCEQRRVLLPFPFLLSVTSSPAQVIANFGVGVGEGVGLGVGDGEGVGAGVGEGVGAGVGEGVGAGVADGAGVGARGGVGVGVAVRAAVVVGAG